MADHPAFNLYLREPIFYEGLAEGMADISEGYEDRELNEITLLCKGLIDAAARDGVRNITFRPSNAKHLRFLFGKPPSGDSPLEKLLEVLHVAGFQTELKETLEGDKPLLFSGMRISW